MKKMNRKGFLLAEGIAVAVVVMTALVLIYTQFVSVDTNYFKTFNFNGVNNLYLVNQYKEFINNNDNSFVSSINDQNLYLDITDCGSYFIEYMYCENLMDSIGAKRVIVTKHDTSMLASNVRKYDFSENLQSYIKNSKSKEDGYRLIIEFNDDTIASLKLN